MTTTLGDLISKLREMPVANGNASAGGITEGTLKALAKAIVPFVKEAIAEAQAPLLARLGQLERTKGIAHLGARVGELEATALQDGGVWKPDKTFKTGMVTTYKGALWVAQKPSQDVRPGTSDDWRLLHKSDHR